MKLATGTAVRSEHQGEGFLYLSGSLLAGGPQTSSALGVQIGSLKSNCVERGLRG